MNPAEKIRVEQQIKNLADDVKNKIVQLKLEIEKANARLAAFNDVLELLKEEK